MDAAQITVIVTGTGTALTAIGALIASLTARGKGRSDIAAAVAETQDRALARLDGQVQSLLKRVDSLEAKLAAEERKVWQAVGYIRRLIDSHRQHAPDADIPDPPEALRDVV